MKKTTLAQMRKLLGAKALSSHSRERNPVWDSIDKLQPKEGLVFEVDEWPFQDKPKQRLDKHYKGLRKFVAKRHADGRFFVVRLS